MDVEGSEIGVMESMLEILKENKSLKIMTEFQPLFIRKFGRQPEEFLKLFLDAGFKIYDIKDNSKTMIQANSLEHFTKKIEEKNNTSLLCVKY